jgi:chromosome segregation ATPase
MSLPEAGKIQELLQKKIKLVDDLLSYAKQQAELSYIDNPVYYDNIVESRRNLIEEIKKLDIVLQRSLGALPESKGGVEARINEANHQIASLAKQIVALDERSKALMACESRTVKNKLEALQKGKKGIKGYDGGTQYNPAGAFTDSRR